MERDRTVEVYYKSVADGHFFWSHSNVARGLLVSDVDLEKAVSKVTETLERRTGKKWIPDQSAQHLVETLTDKGDSDLVSALAVLAREQLKVSMTWMPEMVPAQ